MKLLVALLLIAWAATYLVRAMPPPPRWGEGRGPVESDRRRTR